MKKIVFLSILGLFCAISSANAQVIGRPHDNTPLTSVAGDQQKGMIKAIAILTSQNRGNDAMAVLSNAVNAGTIPSDHRTMVDMSGPAAANVALMKSGQTLNTQQTVQLTTWLCTQRRGDEAVEIYQRGLNSGAIKATP